TRPRHRCDRGRAGRPGGACLVSEPASYVRVCALADVPEDGVLGVEVRDTPIAIARAGGEVPALHDVCSHAEVPLSEGEIIDGEIECWLHGSTFDLKSGKPSCLPAV